MVFGGAARCSPLVRQQVEDLLTGSLPPRRARDPGGAGLGDDSTLLPPGRPLLAFAPLLDDPPRRREPSGGRRRRSAVTA